MVTAKRRVHNGCLNSVLAGKGFHWNSYVSRLRAEAPHVSEVVKMSRGQMVRAWVRERLTAAAEEISALFERTTAENEDELCRYKEENRRKQQLLDVILAPRVLQHRADTGPGLNQDFTETQTIKEEPEEQSVSQEEELLPGPVPELIAVRVKSEELSPLQQRQIEHRKETQGEDSSDSETEGNTELSPDTDNDDDWEPPLRFSAAQMEIETDGDRYDQEQSTDRGIKLSSQNKSAPETTANNRGLPGNDDGAERNKHQCHYCQKRFKKKYNLQIHIRVHTGEKPYICSICKKTFTQSSNLNKHRRLHSGDKPYNCSSCEKTFTQKQHLDVHRRTHTGEKPYSCSICKKSFNDSSNLNKHRRLHSGDKPYNCSSCEKTFALKHYLDSHRRTHTGEKPYSCTICIRVFGDKSNLNKHMRTHRGQGAELDIMQNV